MRNWRIVALITGASLLLGTAGCAAVPPQADSTVLENQEQNTEEWEFTDKEYEQTVDEYAAHLRKYASYGEASGQKIVIPAAGFVSEENSGAYVTSYMGKDSCLYWETPGGSVTWQFNVEQEGLYQLAVDFCGISYKSYDVVMDVLLDGEAPFRNCQNISLHRQFLDETYFGPGDHAFAQDLKGNELRPSLTEQFEWRRELMHDSLDQYPGALSFYLSEGEHTLTLRLKEEALAISDITFVQEENADTYDKVLAAWNADGAKDSSGYYKEYEAEASYLKNDITLFATYDTAYEHVTPSSATTVLYNTIGKNTWRDIGQTITWEIEVPEDGYYNLAFKVKQYDKSNAYSVRTLTIDGKSLYKEMETIKFPYASKWYMKGLEDENGAPLKVYLTKGRHVLGLTANLDEEFSSVLRSVDLATKELQHWYREIIKVTGFNADGGRVTIDTNRDFNLERTVPGLLEGLDDCRQQLMEAYQKIEELEGISASSASVLKETEVLLENLIKKPGKIAKRIETFRGNISNLSTWVIDMQSQPLVLDKFMVYSPDVKEPEVGSNFGRQLLYRTKMFFYSFKNTTNSITGSSELKESDVTLRVWISTADITTTGASSGRDQAIILKKLIDEYFTAKTGINVDVSLVGGSDTLIQAVLAGEGPDVALFTSTDTPVNLAMRGALLDLSRFEDFESVISQFTESAVVPFWYKGGCYAFPETQNFNVLFYRTDIYEELGLEPPTTWDEFYEQIILLSNANYMVGVPQNQNVFETYLYQMGETFYSDDLSRSSFHTNEALKAFEGWTNLYTKYSLSLIFDFFNRFRSGEMALAIEPYNQVNYLYSAAPELDGLWDIAVMPGTKNEDGTVNSVETCSSTGAIALADTEYPEEAYEFLKWWVSADTQGTFGVQVEQTLGVAARYGTANLEAFEQIPWSVEQADIIRSQRENTVAVEQIPGNYYIARNLSFAFRAVVYNKKNLRETLYKYNIEINKELKRKQKEFSY